MMETRLELWKSDGTTDGTVLVKDIVLGSGSLSFSNGKTVETNCCFTVDDGVNGRELWFTDSTTDETDILLDINPATLI